MDRYRRVLRRFLERPSATLNTASRSPGCARRTTICPAPTTCPASAPTAVMTPSLSAFKLGVAEIFAGLDLLGARRIELRLRGLEGLERLIVLDLRRVAVLQQFPLAVLPAPGCASPRLRAAATSDFATSRSCRYCCGSSRGEQFAFFDLGADIDRPLENLAVDPKADIGLVARLDLAGQRQRSPRFPAIRPSRCARVGQPATQPSLPCRTPSKPTAK